MKRLENRTMKKQQVKKMVKINALDMLTVLTSVFIKLMGTSLNPSILPHWRFGGIFLSNLEICKQYLTKFQVKSDDFQRFNLKSYSFCLKSWSCDVTFFRCHEINVKYLRMLYVIFISPILTNARPKPIVRTIKPFARTVISAKICSIRQRVRDLRRLLLSWESISFL